MAPDKQGPADMLYVFMYVWMLYMFLHIYMIGMREWFEQQPWWGGPVPILPRGGGEVPVAINLHPLVRLFADAFAYMCILATASLLNSVTLINLLACDLWFCLFAECRGAL